MVKIIEEDVIVCLHTYWLREYAPALMPEWIYKRKRNEGHIVKLFEMFKRKLNL